ncbi:MAG: tyrosine-type recombinase/integrase [Solirubrobacteraceae bacterium]
MPRKPPAPKTSDAKPTIGSRRLPRAKDATKTWSGPPTQRGKRWSGQLDKHGAKHHVGTFDTPDAWEKAAAELIARLDNEKLVRECDPARDSEMFGMTVAEFVGAPGEGWPWDHTRNGKRKSRSTFEQLEDQAKSFVEQFGDRPILHALSAMEANAFANKATRNKLQAARCLLDDAQRIEPVVFNPLDAHSKPAGDGRKHLPDVLSVEEIEVLASLARASEPGGYGEVLEAAVRTAATNGIRPGELFALRWDLLSVKDMTITVQQTVRKDATLGSPKYDQVREVPMPPSLMTRLLEMPRVDPTYMFPTKTGVLMRQSNWTTYWHPLRDAFTATLPDDHWLPRRIRACAEAKRAEPDPAKHCRMSNGKLDFYEMRHRAITFLGTPRPHGLGLASADIAYIVGHLDGGQLIDQLYKHRNAEQALARIRDAMREAEEE